MLVHEHLNLCANCMRNYRELKGTGKALESVPELRAVQGSAEFKLAVRAQAVMELQNIVAKLPPDKRLKLEARRAARLSRVIERPEPKSKRALSTTALILLCGIAALAIILYYPQRDPQSDQKQAGTVSVVTGKVEQFYQRAGESHSAVSEGKSVYPGDSFSTPANGRARIDLGPSGSVFLGPASALTFRVRTPETQSTILMLEKGELGLQRPDLDESDDAETSAPWEVRSEAGTVVISAGSHVYLRLVKEQKVSRLDVLTLSGSARLSNNTAKVLGTVFYGHKAMIDSASAEIKSEAVSSARVPKWRMDLVSESELASFFSAAIKVTARNDGALAAELIYSANSVEPFSQDWISEPATAAIEKYAGALLLPASTNMRHLIPFNAPLSIEVTLTRDGQGEGAFAFGALDSEAGGISVDVGREARLQIREKGRTVRSASTPARGQSGKIERLRLDILAENSGFAAQLSSSADRTNSLPLPKELQSPKAKLWLQGLSDSMSFSEVKISGVIPAEWLHERISR